MEAHRRADGPLYAVKLAGEAEARWLAGPSGPLADPERRPLTGWAVHRGGGLVVMDEWALRALAALPPHHDGRVEWGDGGPVLVFGRDVYAVVEESSPAQT